MLPVATKPDNRPRVRQSVELKAADGTTSLGRVQAAAPDHVTLAVSFDVALADAADPGAAFDLTWPRPLGIMVLPVTLVERSGSSQMQLWELKPTAAAHFKQLRHETRVKIGGTVSLAVFPDLGPRSLPETDTDPQPLTGELVDLSEGALQCVIPVDAADAVIVSGSQVQCSFSPPGAHFELRGSVLSAWTSDSAPQVHVVVRFDYGQAQLDELQHYLADTEAPS